MKSRLFLVGPALPAISVSRRATGREQRCEGPDLLLRKLPAISSYVSASQYRLH